MIDDPTELSLRLRRDAVVVESEGGWPRLETLRGTRDLPFLSAPETAALKELSAGGFLHSGLRGGLDGSGARLVEQLGDEGWLDRTLRLGEQLLVTVEPLSTGDVPIGQPRPEGSEDRLSRFASLRSDRGRCVIESGRSRFRVVVHAPEVGLLVAQLSAAGEPALTGHLDVATPAVLEMLRHAGMLATPAVEASMPLVGWAANDLELHQRSRLGRSAEGYGATQPGRAWARSSALRKGVGENIKLRRLDRDTLIATDPPLQQALEHRRSHRDHDDNNPLTLDQLSEMLFRVARSRAVGDDDAQAGGLRPYASAGGLYELDIYPVVRLCDGLQRGVYRYAPIDHTLECVAPDSPTCRRLLRQARASMGATRTPQVVLVVTANIGAVAARYEAIVYPLVLKNVGVLLAHLSIAASVTGLAGCPLGGGSADQFARATGCDPYECPSVGEFAIGSRAT